jgi:hypothetical protein
MRITKCEPFREVGLDEYREGEKAPLHFEYLNQEETYVARFLMEKEKKGADFYVKIGKIALKPRLRLFKPQTHWGYPLVAMQWVPHDIRPAKKGYDTRPVSWEGHILGKQSEGAVGYFLPEGTEQPDDQYDIVVAQILIADMAKDESELFRDK